MVVIGGGAAGLTAAAAAASKGASVVLLEQELLLLHMQDGSTTRQIHPFIYDWPSEHYSQTTEKIDAPLLQWSSRTAGEVANWIRLEFNNYAAQFTIKQHIGIKNARIEPASLGQPRKVIWETGDAEADVIILAVGFGLEREFPPVAHRSYWHDDKIHQYFREGPKHLLLSGVGDGGLIDLLRLRISDFTPEEAVSGPFAVLFKKKEMAETAKQLLIIEQESSRIRLNGENPDAFISKAYSEIEPPDLLDRLLTTRLRKDTQATLNGPTPFPLGRGASILNRFLVSRLIYGLKDVKYWPGKISEGGIEKHNKSYVVSLESGEKRTFDDVIIRHGATPALKLGFPDLWEACEKELRRSAELDQTRIPLWPPGWFEELGAKPQFNQAQASTPPIPPQGPISSLAMRDIEKLFTYSREERVRLSKHMSLPVDGGILIPRDCLTPLSEAVESGSILVTGEPGAGKTGVLLRLAEQLEAASTPIIFLPVERLSGFRKRSDFRDDFNLTDDPINVLSKWPDRPGLLIIDALDASRGSPSEAVIATFIEEAISKLQGRWTILASIRSFDLRNGARFRELMRGSPPNTKFIENGLNGIRHFHVPRLSDGEVKTVLTASQALRKLHESAPPQFSGLLRNVFNLSLAAELLSTGEDPQSIRTVATQSDLIRRYEDARLSNRRLQLAVKATVSTIIQHRQLTVRATDIGNEAVDDVLTAGVLVAAGDKVSFAHHVLFDHMAARFYLSADNPTELRTQITQTPMMGLLLGPALRFKLEEVWDDDGTGRPKSWRFLAELAEGHEPDPIVQSIAVKTVAQRVTTAEDVEALCMRIESGREVEAIGRLVGHLSRFVGIVATERGPLAPPTAEAWARVARLAASTKIGHLVDGARVLLMTIMEQANFPSLKLLNTFGDAARTLLTIAWSSFPEHQNLSIMGIRSVASSYETNPTASRELLSRILHDRFEKYAPIEAPWLAEGVTSIIPHDPDFASTIYETIFSREITDKSKTWIGGTPSQIMPLSSNNQQDYQHARWHLNEALPDFLEANPRAATGTVNKILKAINARRHKLENPQTPITLTFRGDEIQVTDDIYSLQDWRNSPSYSDDPLPIFVAFLRDCSEEAFYEVTDAALRGSTSSAVWARILGIASERPESVEALLWPLVTTPRFTMIHGLRRDALIFLAATYPRQSTEQRTVFESMALKYIQLPNDDDSKNWRSVLGEFFSLVPETHLITPAMRELRSEMEMSNELKGNRPDISFSGWFSTEEAQLFMLQEQKVNLTQSPEREIHAAIHKLEKRLNQHAQSENEASLTELWADTHDVISLLEHAKELHPHLKKLSWGEIGKSVQIISESPSYSPSEDGLPSFNTLLELTKQLIASPYPLPEKDTQPSSQLSWSNLDVRVYAALSLVALAPRFGREFPIVIEQMTLCLHDPSPVVRNQVAASLTVLWDVARDHMWTLVSDVVATERHSGVLNSFVTQVLSALSKAEPDRCAPLLDQILKRDWISRHNERDSSQLATDSSLASLAAFLYVYHKNTVAWDWLDLWASNLRHGKEYTSAALAALREVFFFPYSSESTLHQHELAARARKYLEHVIGAAVISKVEARSRLTEDSSNSMPETWRDLYAAGDNALFEATIQLYFGSGAFRTTADPTPKTGLHTASAKRDFLTDYSSTLNILSTHSNAATAHKLIEIFTYAIEGNPAGVFDRATKLLLGSAASHGYQFETLALGSLVKMIRLYLSDHREIFEDTTRRQALIAALDLFSSAGWPDAMKLLFDLPDLLR
ncbi:ATP-binding protein [Corallococcus interemptor]|uniref:FAD-dependent oxidoreductase n=1 Tax=Corallococcus interemptor TaxID=2316720 RepID=UPI0035D43D89